jgi:hypothetical protein
LILNYFTKEKSGLIYAIESSSGSQILIKMKGYLTSNLSPWFQNQRRGDFFQDLTTWMKQGAENAMATS